MEQTYIVDFNKIPSLSGGYMIIRAYVEGERQIAEPTDNLGRLVLETAEEMFKKIQESGMKDKRFTFSVSLNC